MMRPAGKYLSLFLILFSATELQADPYHDPSLEVKAGYFFFADKKMRSIYDEGGLDLQLSASFPLWRWLQLYTSVEYLQKGGHSLASHQKTDIWQIPVTVGLKGCLKVSQAVYYYLTLGPRYFYVHVHNDSSFVDRSLHKNGIGGFLGTGFTFVPCSHFIIDLFGEYSYEKTHFHSSKANVYTRNIQVGGFVFGGGVGYTF